MNTKTLTAVSGRDRSGGASVRNVFHMIDSWGPGGAETVFLQLVTGLERTRWGRVTAVPRHGWMSQALEARGVTPLVLPSAGSFNLPYLTTLVRAIRDSRAALVHAHLPGAALYGSLAGAIAGVPVICTFHGRQDLDHVDRGAFLRYRLMRLGARRVVCVSHALESEFLERSRFPAGRSTVVHNGIDLKAFSPGSAPEIRREIGCEKGDVVVGTVGNLRPAKALDVFVRAAALLLEEDGRFRFVIAGDKDPRIHAELQALAREYGLSDRLHFLGFRSDVDRVTRSFDVYVCSSDSEGFSLTTVQAMASGVPVVATRSGGPEEIIRDGVDGLLVDVRAPHQIADAVQFLVRKPSAADEMRRQALIRVHEKFSLDAMVRGYERLYEEVLDARVTAIGPP